MKKLISCFVAVSVIASFTGAFAEGIIVNVNGEAVDFSEYDNALPYIENDRTMLPIRAISEKLGAEVSWDESTQTVTIKGSSEISFIIGSSNAKIGDEDVELDAPAVIRDDRTYVPLIFAADALNAEIDWDEEHQLVSVTTTKEDTPMNNRGWSNGGWTDDGKPHVAMAMSKNTESQAALISEVSPKFTQLTFTDDATGETQDYSLFVPENYDETQKYPMVMFIPDMTSVGKTAKEEIETYYGANIWASDEEQAKHPSFVLVPCYTEQVVDDEWNTSEQIETTVKLINYLIESYGIDTDRLYATGQSMGCMTSMHLNSKYPDLFAASMFVSGHWDTDVLRTLEDKKFFYIASEGDGNSGPCQAALKEIFDADGAEYSSGTWSAQLSEEEQNANVSSLISEGKNANMITFKLGTTLSPEDAEGTSEHMTSFNFGYELTAVRDWLFEQSK